MLWLFFYQFQFFDEEAKMNLIFLLNNFILALSFK